MANNYKRGNQKGKQFGGKRNSRKPTCKDKDKETVAKPTNDPSWYSKYPQLVSDTSSLFFSNPLGAKIPKLMNYAGFSLGAGLETVPGMITINTIAVPGYSDSANSPMNAIAREIYSFIRHVNSGSKNYDAPDLMMYLLGIDSCYSFWASCIRAYGVARMYNVRSRYLAVQHLEMMGFDPDDILSNLAQFRAEINSFAVKLSSFAAPASMDFFRRHTDMYTRVYLDEPSPKAQAYMFKLAYYYRFYNDALDGGKMLFTEFPSAKLTLAQVRSVFHSLLDPIIGDEDMNVMSGDILKAYTENGIFKIPLIPEDYATEFVYDTTVLSQIENSMSVNYLDSTSMGVIQNPETGAIIFKPMSATGAVMIPRKILNLHTDAPTSMDVMEATRLMYTAEAAEAGSTITGFGSEIVVGYTLWNYINNVLTPYAFASVTDLSGPIFDHIDTWNVISNVASFNYHPRMIVWVNSEGQYKVIMDLYDLDNYTTLEDTVLANISNTAMLSLFDVGRIALA